MTFTDNTFSQLLHSQVGRTARAVIAVSTLLVLANSFSEKALVHWETLYTLAKDRIVHWEALEAESKTSGAGLHLLSDQVLTATRFLGEANAETFQLSQVLKDDPYLSQRISEVAWPREINPKSQYVLRLVLEPPKCTTLFLEMGVALDRCE